MGLARCEAPLTAHNEKLEAFRVSGGCGIVSKILSAVQEKTILLHKEGDIIMRKLLARKILRVWLLAVVCAAGMSFSACANQTVTLAVSSGENIPAESLGTYDRVDGGCDTFQCGRGTLHASVRSEEHRLG